VRRFLGYVLDFLDEDPRRGSENPHHPS
jgi:hypothetical protein